MEKKPLDDEMLREVGIEIYTTMDQLAKECKKPNFEKMQILTKTFKKQIRKSKNYIKRQLENPDNLLPERLQEYLAFADGCIGAINIVCSDRYCPEYKKSDDAYREICQDLKVILQIEVVNQLNVILPLSKISNKNYIDPTTRGGKKKKRKNTRKNAEPITRHRNRVSQNGNPIRSRRSHRG